MSDGTTFDDELLAEVDRLRQEVGQLRRSEHDLQERNQDLAALASIATAVNQSLELQEVVDVAVERTLDALNISGGVLCLFDQTTATFMPASYRNVGDEVVAALTGLAAGAGLPGMVEAAGEPLVIPDLAAVEGHDLPAAVAAGLSFCAGIPIRGEGGLLGVLVLLDARLRHFPPERLDLLGDIGDQIGRAVANARSFRLTKQQIVERMVGEQQRARLVKQLQEQVTALNELVDALPAGLLLVDGRGRVVASNQRADELVETLGEVADDDTLVAVGGVAVADLLSAAGAGPHAVAGDDPWQLRSHPVAAGGDAPALWAIELRRAAVPLPPAPSAEACPAAAADIVVGLSRNLDTALSVIGLYAGMSLTAELPAKVVERLQIVCEEARRAEQVIRKTMDACQINVYSRRPFNLDELVRETTGELGLKLPATVNLELVYGGDDFPVDGDPEALRQVIVNLAANAERAMPAGGQLRIALRRIDDSTPPEARWPGLEAGDWVQIAVTDEGAGIAAEVLPHIFEPFYTTVEGAAGLGLAQVEGIVRQHGGHIDVVSEVGSGTTFAVILPALPSSSPGVVGEAALARAARPDQSVLVVVADPGLRSGLADALTEMGYRVATAGDVEAAAARLATEASDLAVVEIQSQALAATALARLRAACPALKALLMSWTAVDLRSMEELGWNGCIAWPPRLDQLAEVVAQSFRSGS